MTRGIRTSITYYRLEGHTPVSCDLETWAKRLELDRHVAEDLIGDVRVSTVFLGIDHQFIEDAPPLVFETMIFGGPHNQEQWRYSTWEQAEKGHQRAVKLAKEEQT